MARTAQRLRWILGAILMLVCIPVVQEWFVEFAREKHFYDQPSRQVDGAMSMLSLLAGDWRYQWAVIFVAGLFVGACLDWLARKYDSAKAQKGEEGQAQELSPREIQEIHTIRAESRRALVKEIQDIRKAVMGTQWDETTDLSAIMSNTVSHVDILGKDPRFVDIWNEFRLGVSEFIHNRKRVLRDQYRTRDPSLLEAQWNQDGPRINAAANKLLDWLLPG